MGVRGGLADRVMLYLSAIFLMYFSCQSLIFLFLRSYSICMPRKSSGVPTSEMVKPNPSWVMLGIYPEIVARVGRSSLRSLAVLAAVWKAKVAGSNPGCVSVMHVFAKPIS